MNNAIKLAIENGGYDPCNLREFDTDYSPNGIYFFKLRGNHEQTRSYEEVVLDPLFWQALGKALGWGKKDSVIGLDDREFLVDRWHYQAMQYFDLVLTGGDTEKFWEDLLK